jgi:hypothetical protein
MTWDCFCGDTAEDFTRLLDHFRLLHPDLAVGEVEWPHSSPASTAVVSHPGPDVWGASGQ